MKHLNKNASKFDYERRVKVNIKGMKFTQKVFWGMIGFFTLFILLLGIMLVLFGVQGIFWGVLDRIANTNLTNINVAIYGTLSGITLIFITCNIFFTKIRKKKV